MKLYIYPGAPSPLRVELMLKYKGIQLDTQVIDLRAGEQFGDDFRRINPRCTVPALELDDGSSLSEVISICWYLDRLYPDKPVFGGSDLERAWILGWTHRIFHEGFTAVAEVLRNTSKAFANRAIPGPDEIPQLPELAERGRLRIGIFFRTLDAQLAGREFLVGERLSQADIDAYVIIGFARWVKEQPADSLAQLAAWRNRVAALLE